MSYSVNTLLSDLAGVVHGTTINKIPNIYGAINRGARAVLLDVDPKETQRIVSLSQVFDDVYDYACPIDLKGDRTVDLRPQAGRIPSDIYQQTYAQTFDSQKAVQINKRIYTQWNTGVKTIRIEAPTLTSPVVISDTGTLQGWTAIPNASNLSLDTTYNVAGGGDIQFDLDDMGVGTFTGGLQNSTLTALDLSSHEQISTLFLWVYMPTGANITNITLQFGSSVSDYWTISATDTQQDTAFVNGWNLIAFPWKGAPSAGTPNSSLIQYVETTFTYTNGGQIGMKIDNLTSALGFYFELQYYSKFLFRDPSTNVFQETVDSSLDNTKLINLDTESYNLLFNKVAFFVAQQLQGADAEYDADYWQTEYQNALAMYKAANPSEAMKKAESYYTLPQKGYGRYQSYQFRQG